MKIGSEIHNIHTKSQRNGKSPWKYPKLRGNPSNLHTGFDLKSKKHSF